MELDAQLIDALDALAAKVGFEPTIRAAHSCEWVSAYARLLLWPADCAALREGWLAAEAELERRMEEDERDAYLVLALPAAPTMDQLAVVTEIELDRQLCRKHVVWPESGGMWPGLSSVTALGLPDVPNETEVAPTWIPTEAERLLLDTLPTSPGAAEELGETHSRARAGVPS